MENLRIEAVEGYKNQLKNKLYGLLCEREKQGEWEAFLNTILIELMPDDNASINQITLFAKLSKLKFLEYKWFRKTIFDCINLISKEKT